MWDETRWMDTSTWRGRWIAANYVAQDHTLDPQQKVTEHETPKQAVRKAMGFLGNPTLTHSTYKQLFAFAIWCEQAAGEDEYKQQTYPVLRQNALRMLLATSPDVQTC